MMLLLDIGNTRLKWALWDGGLRPGEALVHDGDPLAAFSGRAWPAVEAVWIAAVPRMADEPGWAGAVERACGRRPQFARSSAEWRGLRNVYAEPQRLGIDRWLGMVALWQQGAAPFLLISAGTALTVDRVARDGRHLGGLIAPGFGTMQASLRQVTVTPDGGRVHEYGAQLGDSSESAIRQGAFFAALGLIERALRAPGADADEQLYLTGGDAAALLPHLPAGWQLRSNLVLDGLAALATPAT